MSFFPPFQQRADLGRSAEKVGEDATVLAALLCNTATLGTYRIQGHSHQRAKDVIEHGRRIGRLNLEKYRPLVQDVQLAAQNLHETVEGGRAALQRMHLSVGRLFVGMPEMEENPPTGTTRGAKPLPPS
ncbi:hypothetical protein TraAM80_06048 [Trypanosoma rangeli]|uniref:Uncharacterized protein n=1 Tax=Trypanosoma rangeli TaxID=5698 RepID=A0A422NBY2_TRYRA|nr:uncharacterized protein TraAM80_06048 [Trypanosoma rangeli]RNF02998.1 hypothetical protein TraAM80_06048 [Trypanosoma rangeli]|eukprot:RNF02998.1 hypothetical protein TraAM80_06048 [Trypanosoma rangeli]